MQVKNAILVARPAVASRYARELALMPLIYLLYFLVRAQAVGNPSEAFRNANHVIAVEKWFGIFMELEFQRAVSLSQRRAAASLEHRLVLWPLAGNHRLRRMAFRYAPRYLLSDAERLPGYWRDCT